MKLSLLNVTLATSVIASCATPRSVNHQNIGASDQILRSTNALKEHLVAYAQESRATRESLVSDFNEYARSFNEYLVQLRAKYQEKIEESVGQAIRGEPIDSELVVDTYQPPVSETRLLASQMREMELLDSMVADIVGVERAAVDVQANAETIATHPWTNAPLSFGVDERGPYSPRQSSFLRGAAAAEVEGIQLARDVLFELTPVEPVTSTLSGVEEIVTNVRDEIEQELQASAPAENERVFGIIPVSGTSVTTGVGTTLSGAALAGALERARRRRRRVGEGLVRSYEAAFSEMMDVLKASSAIVPSELQQAMKTALKSQQLKDGIEPDVDRLLRSVRVYVKKEGGAPGESAALKVVKAHNEQKGGRRGRGTRSRQS